MGDKRNISVIVPALNEEAAIEDTLLALRQEGFKEAEIIVVDGGSSDKTCEIAGGLADKVITSARGRGLQMNAGARAASGEILLFIHADCIVPAGAYGLIRLALADDKVSAGAFDLRIDHEGAWARVLEWTANRRSRLTGVPYGDQGLFTRKETFDNIGGFKEMPLMEDMEIAGRIKKAGSIVFLDERIFASPRRWVSEGVLRTTLRDWAIAIAYTVFKVSPERLARHYGDMR